MTDDALTRVRRAATVLRILTCIAIGLLCLALGIGAVLGTLPDSLANIAGVTSDDLTRLHVLLVLAAGALPAAATLWTLGQTQTLFHRYSTGEILTVGTAGLITRIGAGLFAIAVLGVIARPLQTVIASAANPPGERVLTLSFGSPDLGLLLAGGLMTVIGWIMTEAARIADDNKGFV